MKIWIDGDACPNAIKQVIFKAADKRAIETTLVANHHVRTPNSQWIQSVQVAQGFDVADHHIAAHAEPGDLVITADVPLADELLQKDIHALNPRGTLYTKENVKSHLQSRDMREELRASGMVSGGPPPFGDKDVQAFANAFDRFVTRALNTAGRR